MGKPLTLFQKILLSLILAILLIILSDILLQYFFDISLNCAELIIPLAIVGIANLFTFFSQKQLFVTILICIISGFALIFYHVTQKGIGDSRIAIAGHKYDINVRPHGYSIIRYYDFAEKIIATKKSNAFFDPDSKTGIDLGYQVKILNETSDSLFIEINSQFYVVDSLRKKSLWSKH
ncbi:MAG: hypothetical protein K0S24_655 [Sphingobacterium sp.]|jgi:hypothetical protein|nr:hypothetical protein [Sphingobacterium sp.]